MFKVGDKVRAWGVDGIVTNHRGLDADYPVIVKFDHDNLHDFFTLDGKLLFWHKEPSLVLVERAEKFEEVVGYVPVKTTVYETKEEALAQPNAVGYREIKYFRKVES